MGKERGKGGDSHRLTPKKTQSPSLRRFLTLPKNDYFPKLPPPYCLKSTNLEAFWVKLKKMHEKFALFPILQKKEKIFFPYPSHTLAVVFAPPPWSNFYSPPPWLTKFLPPRLSFGRCPRMYTLHLRWTRGGGIGLIVVLQHWVQDELLPDDQDAGAADCSWHCRGWI